MPPGFSGRGRSTAAACLIGSRRRRRAERVADRRHGRERMSAIDPITVEVIRHGLAAASREMGVTLRKTSCSPIFNEGNDYSCGDLRRAGQTRQPRRVPADPPRLAAVLRRTRSRLSATKVLRPATRCCSTTRTAAARTCPM